MDDFVCPPVRINLCNIFPRNGRAIRAEPKGELQQRHVRGRQVRVAIVAEQLIELFLRFAEQTQHLIMRGGAIRISICRRQHQQQTLLLLARKRPVFEEDRCKESGFGLNQPRQQALTAEQRWYESNMLSKDGKRRKRNAQPDLSKETHSSGHSSLPAGYPL